VFLRAGQMAELDARRNEVLGRSASMIQRKVRSFLAQKSFLALRRSALQIQTICRGEIVFLIIIISPSTANQNCNMKFL
jgi:myosin V